VQERERERERERETICIEDIQPIDLSLMKLLTVVDKAMKRNDAAFILLRTKSVVLLALGLVIIVQPIDCLSIKYRRWCSPWKFCSFTEWKPWSSCDKTCGGGVRTRFRQMCSLPVIDFAQHVATCHRTFDQFVEYENCSQLCSSYGVWSNSSHRCVCDDASIVDSCCLTGE
jgi:hypothetical protein